MAVSSLRERLSKLQSKTRSRRDGSLSTPSSSDKKEKKSFFNADNAIDESSLTETNNQNFTIDIPNLTFPDIDTSKPPSPLSILKAANRLSKRYIFPQINRASPHTSLISTNSKTSKISRQYPNILIQDQLYSIFKQNETLIDKIVDDLISNLKLRIFNMNFENFNFNILIVNDEYNKIINNSFTDKEQKMKENFVDLINSNPHCNQISTQSLLSSNLNPSILISKGLICISNSDTLTSTSNGLYNLTLPHLGGLLRVIKNSAKWITTTTAKTREKLITSNDLQHLWFKPFIVSKNLNSAFNREYFTSDRVGVAIVRQPNTGPGINIVKFRGLGLEWILSLLIGTGILECYHSPVGIIYKSTGKHL